MMFPTARKRHCRRRNPPLARLLGLLSALMIGGGVWLTRYHGEHEWMIVAALICVTILGLATIGVIARNQGEDGESWR